MEEFEMDNTWEYLIVYVLYRKNNHYILVRDYFKNLPYNQKYEEGIVEMAFKKTDLRFSTRTIPSSKVIDISDIDITFKESRNENMEDLEISMWLEENGKNIIVKDYAKNVFYNKKYTKCIIKDVALLKKTLDDRMMSKLIAI